MMEASVVAHIEKDVARPASDGFEQFFRAHYSVVARIAFNVVRDTDLAQDVAQEVFIAAQRRFSQPDASDHAAAWVRVAAAHLGLNALRASRRRDVRQRRDLVVLAPLGPEEQAVVRDEQAQVRAAIARLPLHCSTVLILRHSGLSYVEVAEAMQVKVGQVGTMLRRAEVKLRKEVERATRS
jgi:RNA polymerase sigma-70 factor (ECF subfamily)